MKRSSYCLRILASNLQTNVNLCLIAVEMAILLFKKMASILLLIASVAALAASVRVKNNLTAVHPIAKQPRSSLVAQNFKLTHHSSFAFRSHSSRTISTVSGQLGPIPTWPITNSAHILNQLGPHTIPTRPKTKSALKQLGPFFLLLSPFFFFLFFPFLFFSSFWRTSLEIMYLEQFWHSLTMEPTGSMLWHYTCIHGNFMYVNGYVNY